LATYLVYVIGLFLVGVRHYVGRGWGDVLNYVTIAEFLEHVPFHTPLPELSQQPYLFQAAILKTDRIGQSILHAFLTTSAFSDARTLFEPAILLTPPLVVCAVALLGRQMDLPEGPATTAALLAGLMPSIALVHLEGFLSQSLSIPFTFCWLASWASQDTSFLAMGVRIGGDLDGHRLRLQRGLSAARARGASPSSIPHSYADRRPGRPRWRSLATSSPCSRSCRASHRPSW
jgi:hypothetical protein